MTSREWKEAVMHTIREFEQSRNVSNPVVQITLRDGDTFACLGIYNGPGDAFVTLHPYPEQLDDMIESEDRRLGELPHTPRVILALVSDIAKVEVLYPQAPKLEGVGFRATDAPDHGDPPA